jgi:hypothetical protein
LAFTIGTDLYFAPGQYNPQTIQGERLLGHELTHVVQQRAGRVRNPMGSGVAVVHDPALEAEAERMGNRMVSASIPIQAKSSEQVIPIQAKPCRKPFTSRLPGPRAIVPSAAGGAILPSRRPDHVSIRPRVELAPPSMPGVFAARPGHIPTSVTNRSVTIQRLKSLAKVTPSSAQHNRTLISKKIVSGAEMPYGWSFVMPGVEERDIGKINTAIDSANIQKDPADWALGESMVVDDVTIAAYRHTSDADGELRFRFSVATTGGSNVYSTHGDTSQLYPENGPEVLSGRGPVEAIRSLHQHNINRTDDMRARLVQLYFHRLSGAVDKPEYISWSGLSAKKDRPVVLYVYGEIERGSQPTKEQVKAHFEALKGTAALPVGSVLLK